MKLLAITLKLRLLLQDISTIVVGDVMNDISPSNIFRTMILHKRFHQNVRLLLAAAIIKVMGTIASQLKALSQNTPQSSIILYLGVSPGSWVLSGREYHRQLSLFNPYSVLFQNLQLFFQMTYSHNLRR